MLAEFGRLGTTLHHQTLPSPPTFLPDQESAKSSRSPRNPQHPRSPGIQQLRWYWPTLSVKCRDMVLSGWSTVALPPAACFSILVCLQWLLRQAGNPHSPLLIQFNKSRDGVSAGRQHRSSHAEVFSSIWIRQFLRDRQHSCVPGFGRVWRSAESSGSGLWPGVFRETAAETLSFSVTYRPERRSQEPSEPVRAHNLWSGDLWSNDAEAAD